MKVSHVVEFRISAGASLKVFTFSCICDIMCDSNAVFLLCKTLKIKLKKSSKRELIFR